MRLLASLLAALVFAVAPAIARDLTVDEQTKLDAAIAQADAAMAKGDMAALTAAALPPAIYEYIAGQNGITVDQLRQAMMQQINAAMAAVTIDSFTMLVDAAEKRELPDGTPYLVIPTETVISAAGNTTKETSPTLAFMADGDWYLMRVADPQQIAVLKTVYPLFANETFPPAKSEAVTK